MTQPTVGVVIPSYNQKKYLSECVEAVLAQTHPPSQIVICDDASTDGSQEIIADYAARYPDLIEALLHPQNLGLSRNFNSGLRRITQRYVSMVSADDYWSPDKLKLEVEALQKEPQAKWAYSAVSEIDERGNFLRNHEYGTQWRGGDVLVPILCLELPVRNYLIESKLAEQIGYFDEALLVAEDWDWRIRLAEASPAVYVDHPTVVYRQHPSSVSSWSAQTFLRSHLELNRKHRHVSRSLPADQRALIASSRRKRLGKYYRRAIAEALHRDRKLLALSYFPRMVVDTRRFQDVNLLARTILPAGVGDRISRFRARDKGLGGSDRATLSGATAGLPIESATPTVSNDRTERHILISAVICSYRRPDTLPAAIQSLADQTLSSDVYEIIVVDNNSKDETREIVQRVAAEHGATGLRITYALEKQIGLSHARNRSIEVSDADIVAYMDDDAVASPQWLESLLSGYAQSADVWAAGGPVDPIWDGTQPKWLVPSMYRMLSLLDLGVDAKTLVWPERIIGVNCSFRRSVFDEIGLFDTDLGRKRHGLLGAEDTEIQQRIHGLEKRIVYVPEALVFHHVPANRMTRRYFAKRAYFTGRARAIQMKSKQGKRETIVRAANMAFPLALNVARLLVPFRIRLKRRGGTTSGPQANGPDGVPSGFPVGFTFHTRETRVFFERLQRLITDFGFLVQAGILAASFLNPRSDR